jgi:hypothetical protein
MAQALYKNFVQDVQQLMKSESESDAPGSIPLYDVVLPQKLIDLNKVKGVYLAGGAVIRLVMKAEFDPTKHDLDFFVVGPTQEIREQRIRQFLALVEGEASRINLYMVDIFQKDKTRVQVIMTGYETIEQVVSHFDFSVSRVWLDHNNVVKALPSAFMSIKANMNFVTTKYQTVFTARIDKYTRVLQLKGTFVDDEKNIVRGEYLGDHTGDVDITRAFVPLPKNI